MRWGFDPLYSFVIHHLMDFFKSLVYVLLWLVGVLESADPQRIKYNNPGLMVDLGVGLWAWPMLVD